MNRTEKIILTGFISAILISGTVNIVSSGRKLDQLRNSVLRLHILANSDTEKDQNLKIKVRDALLESGIFEGDDSLEEAERTARENIPEIKRLSEKVLRENDCFSPVRVSVTNMDFDERVYGNITMPSGNYHTLRVEIGSAEGHNWWCVMYPPLCIPVACSVTDDVSAEESYFDDSELDMIYHPKKYRVRFAVWDTFKALTEK